MQYIDIAIIGGGLAGSTAAAILGRAGIPTVLIDPHPVYPFDFRVEKLSGDEQLDRFYRTGIADSVLRAQRWARFLAFFGKGALRRLRSRVSMESRLNARPSPSSLSSSA